MKNLMKRRVIGIIIVAVLLVVCVSAATPFVNPTHSDVNACSIYCAPCDGNHQSSCWDWWWDCWCSGFNQHR